MPIDESKLTEDELKLYRLASPEQWDDWVKSDLGIAPLKDYTKIYKTQEEIDAEPGVLTRGLMGGGVYGTGSLLTGAAGLAADAVGADDTAQSLLETSQNIARKGQELYPQKADFDQVLNDPSLSNIGEWLGYNVAATAPMMIGSMGIGGVAGLTAKAMLKKAAAEAGEAAVKKATASELALIGAEKIAQEASEKVLENAVRAGTAGSVVAMAPVEAGGMWIDDAQKHGVENTSPIQDALFGAGSAGLEALGLEASVLGKLLGKGGSEVAGTTAETLLGRLGQRGMSALKEGSRQFVNEGILEEAGQEGIAMINEALNAVPGETPDIVTDKGLKRLAESGIVGGVAGFAPGTLMGALRHKTQDKVVPEVKGTTDILGQDGGFEYQNDATNPFVSHETGFGDTQNINQYQTQAPRNASGFVDLLDQEENGLSLSGLSGMNPQDRQLEMLHQSRLNPSALDMLKQTYMADVVGAGFPSDVTHGAAAQSAGVFESNIRQTELGRLAGLLTNLSGAKQQAEEQARDAAIVQSPVGSQLLADRLRQEEMTAVVPENVPVQPSPMQQIQPAFVPLPVEESEVSGIGGERMSEPEMLPQSVPVEVKKTLPVGSKIEWNDKKGNTLAGTITGIRGSRYEIERENPQPGQGKKTFLHTDYKVSAVEPESSTEKKENFSGVNTDSSELAEGFDPLKTLMTPASEEDIRAAEEERRQKDAKKSQLVSVIEDLKQRKEKLVADRDSWASREYKDNSQAVTTGGQDEYDGSTTRTISQLNEGRRNSKIKGFSEQYRETDAAIKALEHRLKTGKYDIQKTEIGDDYLIPEIDEFDGERMPEYQIEKTTSPPVSKTPLETMQNEKASLEQKPNKSAEDWQRIDDLAYGIDDIKQGKEPDMSLIGGEMTDSQKKEADFYRQKQNLYDQKNKLKDKITSAEKKLEKMGAMTPPSVKSEVSTYIHKLYDEMESLDNSIDAAYSEEEKPEASNYDSVADAQDIISEETNGHDDSVKNKNSKQETLSDFFADKLESGHNYKTIIEARKDASEFTGNKVTAGTETVKDVDEAVETGVTKAARKIIERERASGRNEKEVFDSVHDLYKRQPNLISRTSTSVSQQAYSTPAPIAFLASHLAGINRETSVYEPTAGNGMLLIDTDAGRVFANELNDKRAANLESQGFRVTREDATVFTPEEKTDVVIANPPFGRLKDNSGNPKIFDTGYYETHEIDHAIAIKALENMKDDGRAVLILGGKRGTDETRSQKYHAKEQRQFYKALFDNYNVTDHFTIDGKLYEKQGAGYPIDVITIDGRGKTTDRKFPAAQLPRIYKTFDELRGLINEKQRDYVSREKTAQGESISRVKPFLDTGKTDGINDIAVSGRDDGNTEYIGFSGSNVGEAVLVDDGRSGESKRSGSVHEGGTGDRGAAGSGSEMVKDSGGGQTGDRKAVESVPDKRKNNDEIGNRKNKLPVESKEGSGVAGDNTGRVSGRLDRHNNNTHIKPQQTSHQAVYEPRSKAGGMGTLIPKNMADAAGSALDSLVDEFGDINSYVAEKLGYKKDEVSRYFGAEQVDAIALAVSNLEKGKGFIIGDQTGIGKGRVNAAIIKYAAQAGKIPVFVTMKPELYADMIRDLSDIGVHGFNPLPTNSELSRDKAITLPDGRDLVTGSAAKHSSVLSKVISEGGIDGYDAVFTTYDQLNTANGKDTLRREMLLAIAPKALFILDESHNAGGQEGVRYKKGAPLNRADFARKMLQASPNGAFYSSATYAKRPDVMSLYFKTDMNLAVPDKTSLSAAISNGGIPLQQVVAAMLAESGQYIRRERSFEGATVETVVSPIERKIPEQTSHLMAAINEFNLIKEQILKNMKESLKGEGSDVSSGHSAVSVESSNFTSVMHNLISQVMLSAKTDAAVDEAVKSLENNEKPIITVSNTMGSFITDYAAENSLSPGDPMALNMKHLFLRYLEKTRFITEKDAEDNATTRRLTDEELGVEGAEAYSRAEDAIQQADISKLPMSPIDWAKHRLSQKGYRVGEITGRTVAMDYSGRLPVYTTRKATTADKIKTVNDFNSGNIDALIINVSGSTGISLHSSEKFTDQKKRTMIIAQPELNIDVFMQMLGRVFRTGQVTPPSYKLLAVDTPAEKRPMAILGKKMASLNANTTASRTTDQSFEGTPDFLNRFGDAVICQIMADNPDIHRKLGSPLDLDGSVEEDAARRVTGRIPLLSISEQEKLYRQIEADYQEAIAEAEALGTNDLEAKTLKLDAKLITSSEYTPHDKDGGKSPFAAASRIGQYDVKKLGKPHSSDKVKEMLSGRLGIDSITEKDVLRAGEKISDDITDVIRKEALEYYDRKTEGIEDESRLEVMKSRLNDGFVKFRNLVTDFHIGAPVTIRAGVGDYVVDGVVLDIARKSHSDNPLALGQWKMSIAVTDATKQITVPLSKLYTTGYEIKTNGIGIEKSPLSMTKILEYMDKGQSESREKVWIATGNILAAYGALKSGRIINFEDSSGKIQPGIMLPKKVDVEKLLSEVDIPFASSDEIFGFIDSTGSVAKTADKQLTISAGKKEEEIRFTVPASKAKGGRYFLNTAITDITGDFVKSGNVMSVTVSKEKAADVINFIIDSGTGFVADSFRDAARKITGQVSSDSISDSQDDTGIKYSISESGKPGKGMSKQAVSDSLASGRSKMAFKVVQSEDELPVHVRKDIESKGVSGRAEALFDPETGTAYFIADNIGSAKAAQTGFLENLIRHEGRHAAISQMFESRGSRNLFMDRASRLFKADVDSYLKKNGLENTKENIRTAAEEALVEQAVKGGVHALLDEFMGKVVRWARKIFPNLSMTRAEARAFIRRADSALRVGDFAKKAGFSGKPDGKGVLDTEKEPVKYSLKDRPTSLKDLGIATEYSEIKTLDENGGMVEGKKLVISGNFRTKYDELMKVIGGKYRFEKKAGAKGVTARNIYEFKNPPETIENDIAEIIRAHHGLEDMGLKPKFRESEKGTSLFINGDKVHLMASAMKKIGGKFVSPTEPGRKPFLVFNNPDAAKVGKIAAVAKESTDSLARMQKIARDTAQNNLNLLVKPKDESAKAAAGRVFDDLKSLFSKSGITLPSNNTDFVKGLHWVQTEIDIARNDTDMKALYDINERYNAIATQVTTQDRDASQDYYDLGKDERKPVNKALLACDEERVNLTDAEVKERFSLSDKQVKGFRAIRNVLDNKLVQIVNDMVKHAFSDLYLDDDTAREILSRKIVDSLTRNEVTQLLKEYGVDPKEADKVSWLFDWINERKGYIPHKWDSEWLVRVNMPDGETYLLDVPTVTGNILPTKALREGAANKAAVRVIKERIGWSDEQIQEWIDQGNIRLVKSKKMDVDLFHGASMHTMNAIIDSATEKAWEENKDAFSTEQLMKQDDLKKAIRKEMEELFLAKGAGRHFIARKGVKGFRTDIDNILAEYIGGINHWMVKRDKAMEFSKAMKSIDPKETPVKFKHARAFVDDMLGESSEASWFKRFAGTWFLGADVSAAALNGFQNFTHAAPLMMGIKGKESVYSQLGKAMKDAFGEWRAAKKEGRSIFTGESEFVSKEEAGVVRDLYEQGFFDPAVVGEQTGFHPSSVWNNYADVGMRKLMFMFTGVESLNRASSFMAAYRRAKAAGLADPVKAARDVVIGAHFAAGKENRPLLVRRMGAIGNIGYTFMMFPVNNFFFLKNIFKDAFKAIHGGDKEKIKTSLKVVGAHLGALMSIGGLSALPFASVLAPLIKGIFSDDDDDWEIALRKHLPGNWGRAAVRGIPAVFGNDMSGRISGDITGMPAGFGVIQTMAKRANKAGMYLTQGEALDAAMILMPDFIRNPYNAVMGMKEGGEKRGRSPVKYTGWQAFNKAMGFSPTEETEAYAAKQSIDNVKAKRSDMLESFAEDLNQLRKKGNTTAIASLRKKVAEYNSIQAKDDDPVIKWSDVIKSAKQREKMRNKGYMDRVSKGMKDQKKAALAAFEG